MAASPRESCSTASADSANTREPIFGPVHPQSNRHSSSRSLAQRRTAVNRSLLHNLRDADAAIAASSPPPVFHDDSRRAVLGQLGGDSRQSQSGLNRFCPGFRAAIERPLAMAASPIVFHDIQLPDSWISIPQVLSHPSVSLSRASNRAAGHHQTLKHSHRARSPLIPGFDINVDELRISMARQRRLLFVDFPRDRSRLAAGKD
jgi:hypothetical protein